MCNIQPLFFTAGGAWRCYRFAAFRMRHTKSVYSTLCAAATTWVTHNLGVPPWVLLPSGVRVSTTTPASTACAGSCRTAERVMFWFLLNIARHSFGDNAEVSSPYSLLMGSTREVCCVCALYCWCVGMFWLFAYVWAAIWHDVQCSDEPLRIN